MKIAFEIPATEGPDIEYPIAVLKNSKDADAAKKFLIYLESPESLKTFEKYGFIWGGKWYHFDTMHFEYRPELIN